MENNNMLQKFIDRIGTEMLDWNALLDFKDHKGGHLNFEKVGRTITAVIFLIGVVVGILSIFIEKLNYNEFGDYLAGFFGALAFTWMWVSFQQTKTELELQREELRLQRKEFTLVSRFNAYEQIGQILTDTEEKFGFCDFYNSHQISYNHLLVAIRGYRHGKSIGTLTSVLDCARVVDSGHNTALNILLVLITAIRMAADVAAEAGENEDELAVERIVNEAPYRFSSENIINSYPARLIIATPPLSLYRREIIGLHILAGIALNNPIDRIIQFAMSEKNNQVSNSTMMAFNQLKMGEDKLNLFSVANIEELLPN